MLWVNKETIRNHSALYLIFLMIFLFSCATQQNIFQKIEIGQTKQAIKHILGEPKKVKNFKKLGGPIFGPEEEFWDKIKNGTSLEMWNYQSNEGSLNLYFLEGEDVLSYTAFAPKGVVY